MISVPIPIQKEQKLSVKYIPYSLDERPKEFILGVGDQASISEIKQRIFELLPEEQTKS
jgi:hypothetical protein